MDERKIMPPKEKTDNHFLYIVFFFESSLPAAIQEE